MFLELLSINVYWERAVQLVDFESYKHLRNKILSDIRKSKQLQTDKLAKKLKNNFAFLHLSLVKSSDYNLDYTQEIRCFLKQK